MAADDGRRRPQAEGAVLSNPYLIAIKITDRGAQNQDRSEYAQVLAWPGLISFVLVLSEKWHNRWHIFVMAFQYLMLLRERVQFGIIKNTVFIALQGTYAKGHVNLFG